MAGHDWTWLDMSTTQSSSHITRSWRSLSAALTSSLSIVSRRSALVTQYVLGSGTSSSSGSSSSSASSSRNVPRTRNSWMYESPCSPQRRLFIVRQLVRLAAALAENLGELVNPHAVRHALADCGRRISDRRYRVLLRPLLRSLLRQSRLATACCATDRVGRCPWQTRLAIAIEAACEGPPRPGAARHGVEAL